MQQRYGHSNSDCVRTSGSGLQCCGACLRSKTDGVTAAAAWLPTAAALGGKCDGDEADDDHEGDERCEMMGGACGQGVNLLAAFGRDPGTHNVRFRTP